MPDISTLDLDFTKTVSSAIGTPAQVLRIAPKRIDTVSTWDSLYDTGLYRAEFYFTNRYKYDNAGVEVNQPLSDGSISQFAHYVQMNAVAGSSEWVTFSVDYETQGEINVRVQTSTGQSIGLASYVRQNFSSEEHLRLSIIYNSSNGSFVLFLNDESSIAVPGVCNIDPTSYTLWSFGTRLFDTYETFSNMIVDFGFTTSSPYRNELLLAQPLLGGIDTPVPFEYSYDDSYQYNNDLQLFFNSRESELSIGVDTMNNPHVSGLGVVQSNNSFTFTKDVVPDFSTNTGSSGTSSQSDIGLAISPNTSHFYDQIRQAFDAIGNGQSQVTLDGAQRGDLIPKTLPSTDSLVGFQVNFSIPSWIESYLTDATQDSDDFVREVRHIVQLTKNGIVGSTYDLTDPEDASKAAFQTLFNEKNILLEFIFVARRSRIESFVRLSKGPAREIVDVFSQSSAADRHTHNINGGAVPDQVRLVPVSVVPNTSVRVGVYFHPVTGAAGVVVNDVDYGMIYDSLIKEAVTDNLEKQAPFEIFPCIVELGHAQLASAIPGGQFSMDMFLNATDMDIQFPTNVFDLSGTEIDPLSIDPPLVDDIQATDPFSITSTDVSPFRFTKLTNREGTLDNGRMNDFRVHKFIESNVVPQEVVSGQYAHTVTGTSDSSDPVSPETLVKVSTNVQALHDCYEYQSKFRWLPEYIDGQSKLLGKYTSIAGLETNYPIQSGIHDFPNGSNILALELNIQNPTANFNQLEFVNAEGGRSRFAIEIGIASQINNGEYSISNIGRNFTNGIAKVGIEIAQSYSAYGDTNIVCYGEQQSSSLSSIRNFVTPVDDTGNRLFDYSDDPGSPQVPRIGDFTLGMYYDRSVNRIGIVVDGYDQGFVTPPIDVSDLDMSKFSIFTNVIEQGVLSTSPAAGSVVTVTPRVSSLQGSYPATAVDLIGTPQTLATPADHLSNMFFVTTALKVNGSADSEKGLVAFNSRHVKQNWFATLNDTVSASLVEVGPDHIFVLDGTEMRVYEHSGAWYNTFTLITEPDIMAADKNGTYIYFSKQRRTLKYDIDGNLIFDDTTASPFTREVIEHDPINNYVVVHGPSNTEVYNDATGAPVQGGIALFKSGTLGSGMIGNVFGFAVPDQIVGSDITSFNGFGFDDAFPTILFTGGTRVLDFIVNPLTNLFEFLLEDPTGSGDVTWEIFSLNPATGALVQLWEGLPTTVFYDSISLLVDETSTNIRRLLIDDATSNIGFKSFEVDITLSSGTYGSFNADLGKYPSTNSFDHYDVATTQKR